MDLLGAARLVGVSESVLGVVIPLGEGLTPRPEAPQEAAAFLQTPATAPQQGETGNGGNGAAGPTNHENSEAPTRQVRILWTPEHRFVLDNTNALPGSGTLVNGLQVGNEHRLSPGDEIGINGVRFRFEV
jgi:hypothetical protein